VELITSDKQASLPMLGDRGPKVVLETHSKPYSEHCQIEAENDLEAVQCWLQRHKSNQHTFNAYYKESRRLLLWCVYERGLALEQLKVQDFEQYFEFLKNPPIHWCVISSESKQGKKKHWRPLKDGLGESACRMAVRSINSLINYLVEADYLRTNPIKLLNSVVKKSLDQEVQKYKFWERMLEVDEWVAVQKVLEGMPVETLQDIDNKMRTQFLFSLLYLLGLRIHEVALSSWNAFRKRDGRWWFFIKGKGGKPGHVPVNEQLLSYIKSYRLHLGISPLPNLDEAKNLLVSKRTHKPLKVRQLYGLVKAVARVAAKAFGDQPLKKKKLEQLSPHWLRHLSASHQDKLGISATMIQANHRHRSSQTTQIYLHAEDELRSTEIQKLRMNLEPQVIVQSVAAAKVELKITLKGSPVSNKFNLFRLLESIEKNVLRDIIWERQESDLEELLNRYEQLKKFGSPLICSYYLKSLQGRALNDLQKAITREASIRLFECNIFFETVIA
jgi:integrase